ncbi:MAG TPA: ATP synthase F0 subunit C [Verrucomicrobiae bacterium]|nr:ATP synthase F0 subunit C [Verrucomicrobiae bacterium]
MEPEVARLLASAFAIAAGVFGPAIAIGMIGSKGLDSIGRNPETENAVRNTMVLAIVFAESLAIFALVIALIIKFV